MYYVSGVGFGLTSLMLLAISTQRVGMVVDSRVTTVLTLGILPLVALMTVLFYYRRGKGTQLWLSRPAAGYLLGRAKKTRSNTESFALGMMTAVTELPFIVAPLAIGSFIFQRFASHQWLSFSVLYAAAVVLPLIFVSFYLASGHKVSVIQRWREEAKQFLRWTSAITLCILTVYIVVVHNGASI